MSTPRIKPSGWAFREKFTSAQATQLDLNISNSLDKLSGHTDTLASNVTMTGNNTLTGTNTIATGGTLAVAASGSIQAPSGAIVQLNLENASSFIEIGTNSTLYINVDGQLQLAGGVLPTLNPAQTRSLAHKWDTYSMVSSPTWHNSASIGYYQLKSTATGDVGFVRLPRHNGATLASIDVLFSIGSSHLPATQFSARVDRFDYTNPQGSVASLGSAIVTASTASAYYASGATQTLTVPCTTNNVMDTTKYDYTVAFIEESGTSSVAGANAVYGFILHYSNITKLGFV